MPDININDKNITLPPIDNSILVSDILDLRFNHMPNVTFNGVIAECDILTLKYMEKKFRDLVDKIIHCKSSERLIYMQVYESLLHKLKNYTIVKGDSKQNDDIQEFSSLEVHRFKDDDLIINTVTMKPITSDVIVKNVDGTIYDGTINVQDTQNIKERIIDVEYTDIPKSEADLDIEEVKYKADPSQIAMETKSEISLYERLKDMNKEGRIFTDEDRILDKNLNLQNSISLRKIELGELNVNSSKTSSINISKTKILEMGRSKYNTLKNVCLAFNNNLKKRVSSIKLKSKLNYTQSTINIPDNLVLSAPASCCNNIKAVFSHILGNHDKNLTLPDNYTNDESTKIR